MRLSRMSLHQLNASATGAKKLLDRLALEPTWSALHASRARMSARRRLSVGGSFSSRPGVTSLQWVSRREKPHLRSCHVSAALTSQPMLSRQGRAANAPLLRYLIHGKELPL